MVYTNYLWWWLGDGGWFIIVIPCYTHIIHHKHLCLDHHTTSIQAQPLNSPSTSLQFRDAARVAAAPVPHSLGLDPTNYISKMRIFSVDRTTRICCDNPRTLVPKRKPYLRTFSCCHLADKSVWQGTTQNAVSSPKHDIAPGNQCATISIKWDPQRALQIRPVADEVHEHKSLSHWHVFASKTSHVALLLL